jgi:hypothetical protein
MPEVLVTQVTRISKCAAFARNEEIELIEEEDVQFPLPAPLETAGPEA